MPHFIFDAHTSVELAEALETAGLKPELIERPGELASRFADYYNYLCRLPRRARRALQRRWKRSLSAIALLLALGQAPALAATIPVTPGTPPAINADGKCSLIEAMENANGGPIHADCVAGAPGADTITLPAASTQLLTEAHNGENGLPLVSSQITIQGNGSTIKGQPGGTDFRIFAVNNSGKLTVNSCTVTGGSTGYNSGAVGAGIANYGGRLTLSNSTIVGNFAGFLSAGGVFNSGTLTLNRTVVSGNFLLITGDCGGIENYGTATLINSTVSQNSSGGDGGVGGGVCNFGGTLTLTNSTVSGNHADRRGGVLSSGTLILNRALVSGNTSNYYAVDEISASGTITANNFNLFGHDGISGVTGFVPGAQDIVPTQALNQILAPLANNGGATRTHALVAGSPALDAVETGCPPPATDQRGERRARDGEGDGTALCDTGAFERTVATSSCAGGPTSGCRVNGIANRLCLGTAGADVILGSNSNNVIEALGGNDSLRGGQGDDVICGGSGQDKLFGEKGDDRLVGGPNNDALDGGPGPDTCDGGTGSGDSAVSCNTVLGVP